jgi:hypothetical protein
MANLSSDNEFGSEHANGMLPSKGGTCARCGKFIAPLPGAMSKHDEQTLALIRNGLTVSAIKLLRDNTGCDLRAAKEMVKRTCTDLRSDLWGRHARHAEHRYARLVRSCVRNAEHESLSNQPAKWQAEPIVFSHSLGQKRTSGVRSQRLFLVPAGNPESTAGLG